MPVLDKQSLSKTEVILIPMTVFIEPGPDLSANTYFIQCNSLFDFATIAEGETLSTGEKEIAFLREWGDARIAESQNSQATTDISTLSDYRRSQIAWFPPHEPSFAWLIQRMSKIISYFNAQHWNFDVTAFSESCQYTLYDEKQRGHYNWHMDITNKWDASPRKLSAVIQLSNPDEYEGGEFRLKTSDEETVFTKEKGTLFLFPSYMLHKVTPVTRGVRRSFVCWISGPKFR